MDLDKIKNKEARMNTRAFFRYVDENNLDNSLKEEFFEIIKLADKLKKLENAQYSQISGVPEQNRSKLLVLKRRLVQIEHELAEISAKLDDLGAESKKFMRDCRSDGQKRLELRQSSSILDEKLPEGDSISTISPYLQGFIDNE